MEHISKPSEDVGEVVFGQPEERAGETGPHGSVHFWLKFYTDLRDT